MLTNTFDSNQNPPSDWVKRFADLMPHGGVVLDLACGTGRNGRFFLNRGCEIVLLDKSIAAVADLTLNQHVEVIAWDLEQGPGWPFKGRCFDGIIVTNYLYRPIFGHLVDAIAPGGVLIYETFAQGNERFGKPSNPNFLLKKEELIEMIRPALRVVAFEDIVVTEPRPAVIQHIVGKRDK